MTPIQIVTDPLMVSGWKRFRFVQAAGRDVDGFRIAVIRISQRSATTGAKCSADSGGRQVDVWLTFNNVEARSRNGNLGYHGCAGGTPTGFAMTDG